ncbi:MAG: alpha/beta hydrolase [Thermoanaerobaculia bacterium]|nr:alpha/beta hydrolase [Thermoanaerobaculia bacterium]
MADELMSLASRGPFRLAAQVVLWIFVVTALLWALVNMMKRSTLFFPDKYPAGLWDVSGLDPRPTDHAITTPDGVKLHAWLFSAAEADAPLLIFFHGNGGNLSHRADVAEEFARRGVSVLLFDYRGYGKSEGSPGESALYVDGLAVYDYARTTLGVPAERIALYGESLGGPYAADVAANRKVRCVVIESSFPSAASVANAVYRIPIGIFLGNSLPTARSLNRAKVPVLVMHGDADTIIPFACGRELFDALEGPKEMWVVRGSNHNEVPVVGGEEYFGRVVWFVRSAQPAR